MMASEVEILSWNIRGLEDKVKKHTFFATIMQYNPAIVFLQETHLGGDTTSLFHKYKFPYQYHATYSTYGRGVSVLAAPSVQFSCKQCILDDEGRYIRLLCTLNNKSFLWCIFISLLHVKTRC